MFFLPLRCVVCYHYFLSLNLFIYLSLSLTFLVSFSFLTFHFTFESANTITATCPSFPFSLLLLFLHFFLFFSYLSSSLPFVMSSRGLASSCVTSVATEIFRRPVSPFAFRGAGHPRRGIFHRLAHFHGAVHSWVASSSLAPPRRHATRRRRK